jgi:hypothetical protein
MIFEVDSECSSNIVTYANDPKTFKVTNDPGRGSSSVTVKASDIFDVSLPKCRPFSEAKVTAFTLGITDTSLASVELTETQS